MNLEKEFICWDGFRWSTKGPSFINSKSWLTMCWRGASHIFCIPRRAPCTKLCLLMSSYKGVPMTCPVQSELFHNDQSGVEGSDYKGAWENFRSWWICSLSWLRWCIHQNIKLHTLHVFSLLCDNYTSKMLLKIRIVGQEWGEGLIVWA